MTSNRRKERLLRETIAWWTVAGFNAGMLVGIGAMLLQEWLG